MISWPAFAAVFAAFFVTHSVPVRPKVKARLQKHLGKTGFTASYSMLSLGMLIALIWAAKNAPYVQLWPQEIWQRYVVFFGMYFVCVIVGLAILRPNPFSFGGAHNNEFDPTKPGIVRLSRHPMLVAIALWAGLHLMPNGDLAHVILFGVFLVFAILGSRIIDARNKRLMGISQYHALLSKTQDAPLFQTPLNWRSATLRVAIATGVFVLLIILHPLAIGVSPLPTL
ncbi:NnrU family protein [Sulfitobacter sp.]|uniref:NnrU family protein n=1 Tax=Sulfitobacter sp. TaxID=1903071 RepID=UPI003002E0BE